MRIAHTRAEGIKTALPRIDKESNMKRPQGKLTLGLVAVLLLIGAMLLRQHLTQSESPKVNENQAPNSLNASSAASTARTPGNSPFAQSALDQHTIKELPKPPVDGRARGSIEQAIDAVVVAANFDAQIQAIRELGNFQDPRTIKVLGPALHSHVTEVRKAALEAMREGTVEDKATLADVRYAVTNDADPEVRQAALEVLVRYDESPEAKRVLEKLAADPRGPHREQARRELARMEYEADARSRPDTQVQKVQQP